MSLCLLLRTEPFKGFLPLPHVPGRSVHLCQVPHVAPKPDVVIERMFTLELNVTYGK